MLPSAPEIRAPIGIQPQTMNLMEAFMRPSKASGQILCLAVTWVMLYVSTRKDVRKNYMPRAAMAMFLGRYHAIGSSNCTTPESAAEITISGPSPSILINFGVIDAPSNPPIAPMETSIPKVAGDSPRNSSLKK